MGIITKIESQKKRDDRVNIYVDEKFFMAIYKELVFTFNLKKGQEIDPNNLKSILDNEMYMKAKNKALSILSKASQSEKQIRQKLIIIPRTRQNHYLRPWPLSMKALRSWPWA